MKSPIRVQVPIPRKLGPPDDRSESERAMRRQSLRPAAKSRGPGGEARQQEDRDRASSPVPSPREETPTVARYRLLEVDNLAPPRAATTGVTFDGQYLWFISGGHNAWVHFLVQYDPVTYSVIREFEYVGLIETLGTGVYGLTWDGNALWLSVSGNANKLVRVDPYDGRIVRSFSSPTVLGPSDLEFDGTSLWVSSGTGASYRIDPLSGGITQSFAVMEDTGRDSGNALFGEELWIAGLFGGAEVYSAANGDRLGIAVSSDGVTPMGDDLGALCRMMNRLVSLSSRGVTFYEIQAC
jgi:hypothetical protein